MKTTAEVKFTPGPWSLSVCGNRSLGLKMLGNPEVIANGEPLAIVLPVYVDTFSTQDANARLFAAAPEMYEALKAEQFALELASVDDPQSRTRLLESVGDYESGWALNWAIVVEKYRVKAALLRETAIAKAEGRQ